MNAVSLFWRSVIGPKEMSPAQIAFWEREVERTQWRKFLPDNLLVSDFQNARDAAKFLQSEYAEDKTVLTDLWAWRNSDGF